MIDLQIEDSRKLIHGLTDKSIDCVMTSPPYWGLRDYGNKHIIFDGDDTCNHSWDGEKFIFKMSGGMGKTDVSNYSDDRLHFKTETNTCSVCGAWRGQLGLEPTPELFIKHLLDFFDDVKLKLMDTGNLFVNLGDSYMSSGGASRHKGYADPKYPDGRNGNHIEPTAFKHPIIKPKSLVMIPQRFAWGMIERGWILRNEIIWYKKNHMPENVTDRLTKAHEIVYHFVKQSKYYYNLDAIREPHKTQEKRPMGIIRSREWGYNGKYEGNKLHEDFGSPRARTQRKGAEYKGKWKDNQEYMNEIQNRINEARSNGVPHDEALNHPLGKNPGDVWEITTQPYPESHFATFPLELVRRPILAGCPEGGTVLDPFAGSGTVGEFCRKNNRNAILFELNPEYKKLVVNRSMINTPELSSFE